jgi:preprotein translocase subunit SecF
VNGKTTEQPKFFEIVRPGTTINFVGAFRVAGTVSTIIVIASLVLYFVKGFNYGIDFAGGVEVRLEFKNEPTVSALRSGLSEVGLAGLEVTQFLIPGKHVYAVKAKGALEGTIGESQGDASTAVSSIIVDKVTKIVGEGNVGIVSTDMVGPRVGAELRQQALWAIIASLIGMLIYVGWRFEPVWAPGGIIALAHDVIFVGGVFLAMGKEFDLTIVAALLTIAGYSINDTIVIYDRIREMRGRAAMRRKSLPEIANQAINETLSRTILTSGMTMLTVLALWILGGKIIEGFAFALIVGMISGVYSTIYIASPISLFLERIVADRKRRGKH